MFDYTKAEVVTGIFVVLGLLGLGYLSISIGGVRILRRDEYHLSARFSNVGDLKLRAPVKVAGVTVGRVESIRLADYYGEADLAIARAVTLPSDTIASITTAGLLGDSYVSLSPGAADANLRHGDRITIHGPSEPAMRGGVLSFAFADLHPHDISQVLDQHGVCVRAGHHCAKPLMRKLGVSATARASFYVYNDEADVDALNDALEEAANFFAF